MVGKLRSKLSYANVVATLGLFVALGGSAYAAINLPANSVTEKAVAANAIGSAEIQKAAVRAPEIKPNAVGSGQIRQAAITAGDIKGGAIGSGQIRNGSLQPTDFKSTAALEGPTGPTGAAGPASIVVRSSTQVICNVAECLTAPVNATCLAGERAVGGGGYSATDDWTVTSAPVGGTSPPTAWQFQTKDPPGGDIGANAVAQVVCAS